MNDSGDQEIKTEMEMLQYKVNDLTDQSLESTRRMLMIAEDTKEVGIKTLVALDEQGEQLDRIEEDMDKINADMKEAEKALTGMEQFCGLCTCPCNRPKEFKEDQTTWKTNQLDGQVVNGQPTRYADDRNGSANPSTYVVRITNDAREDEMEENMQQVSSVIGNLRNMALDMGTEIGGQNHQLDRINQKTQSNELRIQGANERAQKLIKK